MTYRDRDTIDSIRYVDISQSSRNYAPDMESGFHVLFDYPYSSYADNNDKFEVRVCAVSSSNAIKLERLDCRSFAVL